MSATKKGVSTVQMAFTWKATRRERIPIVRSARMLCPTVEAVQIPKPATTVLRNSSLFKTDSAAVTAETMLWLTTLLESVAVLRGIS